MKTQSLLILLCLLLSSCTTTRKVNLSEDVNTVSVTEDHHAYKQSDSIVRTAKIDENITIEIEEIVYDTDKADSTGSCPVLKVRKSKIEKVKAIEAKEDGNTEIHSITGSTNEVEQEIVHKEKTDISHDSVLGIFIKGLFVIAILLLMLYCVYNECKQ